MIFELNQNLVTTQSPKILLAYQPIFEVKIEKLITRTKWIFCQYLTYFVKRQKKPIEKNIDFLISSVFEILIFRCWKNF